MNILTFNLKPASHMWHFYCNFWFVLNPSRLPNAILIASFYYKSLFGFVWSKKC